MQADLAGQAGVKIGLVATGVWGSIHLDIARELHARGHSISIYTEDNRAPSGMRFTRMEDAGLQFWVIHGVKRNPWTWLPDRLFKVWLGRRFFTTLVAIWRFVRANRDCDVFVVESDWLGFFVGIVSLFEPMRWVVGIHDTDYLAAPIAYPERPVSAWRSAVQRWVLRRADIVRANSYVTRDALLAGGSPAGRTAVVPLHCPARMVPPAEPPLAEFRRVARERWLGTFGVPADAFVLVTMCRLTPVKHLELAVEALAILRRTHDDLWLVLCGGDRKLPGVGSYAASLRALAGRLGAADRLVIAGNLPVEEVSSALASADLHLAPSWIDTFNFAVLEATMAGTLTLASRGVGASPWMGEAVRIVEDDQPGSWAAAIADAKAKAQTVTEASRARVLCELAPGRVAEQLAALYAGVKS